MRDENTFENHKNLFPSKITDFLKSIIFISHET